jgi:DNA end-binding protein Ku
MAKKSKKSENSAVETAGEEAEGGSSARPTRAIWKGNISFGLVNIPVSLHSAESRDDISFRLLDRRTLSPVRYQRVNESTGKEVPWSEIVKGYEYESGQFVVMTDEDLRRANVEASQTVEITDFVEGLEITPVFYDKPYYLAPEKKSRKSYALLREVLQRSGKVGIARIVLRSRQYIAAVFPLGKILTVNLLRYGHELRDATAIDAPPESLKENGITEGEIKMAERLVDAMVGKWDPQKYKDEYRNDLLALIERRIQTGQTEAVTEAAPEAKRPAKVVNIMDLLKRSIQEAEKAQPAPRKRTESRRKAG